MQSKLQIGIPAAGFCLPIICYPYLGRIKTIRVFAIAFLLLFVPSSFAAKIPACSHPDNWAAAMAQVHLKNAKLLNSESVDFSRTEVVLMASEKISKDLYRQIHLITFFEKTGHRIEVITSNEASSEECSMSSVQVFVISTRLGD
jgi:hypothetical protein